MDIHVIEQLYQFVPEEDRGRFLSLLTRYQTAKKMNSVILLEKVQQEIANMISEFNVVLKDKPRKV